ncbi:MAG: thioredoxin domain-containing protein [Syntrophomonadaceae bacterium]|nr:thioredoxin domain-containing protein [Syntrophomonadaceae bacterium]
MIEITKENFEEEVLKASGIVFVDFWGPKCERCMELMPYVEELAEKYAGKNIKFCSCDTTGKRRLAISQKVLGLPAMLFYKDGEKIDECAGQDLSPDVVEAKITEYLEK